MPEAAKDLPGWISGLVGAMHFEREVYLYPRAGAWSSGTSLKRFQLSSIFQVCGVRPLSEEVLVADLKESDALESVVFFSLVHGGTVADDIFVIPDHGKIVLYVDHHEAVTIGFSDEQTMSDYLEKMPCDDDSP